MFKRQNLSIATSESWRDKASGERREKTEWHRVVIFNERLAEIAEKYLKKGLRIYVEGQLQTRKWTDAAGIEKYSTEIVLIRFRGDLQLLDRAWDSSDHSRVSDGDSAMDETNLSNSETSTDSANNLDDDIPF